jgi:hypothetical protein
LSVFMFLNIHNFLSMTKGVTEEELVTSSRLRSGMHDPVPARLISYLEG